MLVVLNNYTKNVFWGVVAGWDPGSKYRGH